MTVSDDPTADRFGCEGEPPCAVAIKDLSLSFRLDKNRSSLKVLDSVTLAVKHGEFLAIVGPSGCGKTTLLRLIGGLLDGSDRHVELAGSLLVNGIPPADAKRARIFGFAFQNPVLLPWRTVRQNVRLPLELSANQSAESEERIASLLELMDVNDFERAHPFELSGGMQQRVNIARALIHQPTILLMDEPFGSLDEMTRERLNLALHKIQQLKNPTIILVTHSLREAAFLANRIVVLTKRPARVKAIVQSALPPERTEATYMERSFLELLGRLRELFFLDKEQVN